MQIQIHNTDHSLEGREELATHVRAAVELAVGQFRDRITRVEVHLRDQNGDKSGPDDKRCMMEARLEGRQPNAFTHQASTLVDAVEGAADKLRCFVERTLERETS